MNLIAHWAQRPKGLFYIEIVGPSEYQVRSGVIGDSCYVVQGTDIIKRYDTILARVRGLWGEGV